VIDLEIDFDGTVVWNGTVVQSLNQLEGYSTRKPRRTCNRRSTCARPACQYDYVAKVLARRSATA